MGVTGLSGDEVKFFQKEAGICGEEAYVLSVRESGGLSLERLLALEGEGGAVRTSSALSLEIVLGWRASLYASKLLGEAINSIDSGGVTLELEDVPCICL